MHSCALTKVHGTFGTAMSVSFNSQDACAFFNAQDALRALFKPSNACAFFNYQDALGRNKRVLGNAQDLKRTQTDAKAAPRPQYVSKMAPVMRSQDDLKTTPMRNQTAGFASHPGFMESVFFMGGIFYFLN